MYSGAEANHIFYIAQASGLKLIYHCAALSSTALQHIYHPESTKAPLCNCCFFIYQNIYFIFCIFLFIFIYVTCDCQRLSVCLLEKNN